MKQLSHSSSNSILTINMIAFWMLFGATFVFIIFKALTLSITHDEVASALYYPTLSDIEIITLANGDQNNHILNTLLTKWSISLFGLKLWAVRLPSMLSFVIYCFAAKKVLDCLIEIKSKFYAIGTLLFILSPYVIDFFCLSRGYGMCVAFVTLVVAYLLRFVTSNDLVENSQPKTSLLFYALISATLACFSSFSSISFLCAMIVVIGYYLINFKKDRWKNLVLFGGILTTISSLLYLPLTRISEADQFSLWHSNGFIEDTLMSIVRLSLYGSKIFLTTVFITYFLISFLTIGCVYFIVQWQKSKRSERIAFQPQFIALNVLLLTVIINIIQGWILHLPNLNGRIALFFYPLIVIALLGCRPLFYFLNSKVKIAIICLVGIFGTHHVIHISKSDQVLEWSYDAHTLKVLNAICKTSNGKKVTLETNWLYQPSLSFHGKDKKFQSITIGQYSKEININSSADFFYCKAEDYHHLSHNFNVFIKFEDNWLLKHN